MAKEFKDETEAHDFIVDTITEWQTEGHTSKIIALAKFAARWNNKGGGPAAKVKAYDKTIKALEVIIRRHKTLGLDTSFYDEELAEIMAARDKADSERLATADLAKQFKPIKVKK